MEWRNREYSEPSHIHIPRPSRASAGQAQSPWPELYDLCALQDDDNDCGSLTVESN